MRDFASADIVEVDATADAADGRTVRLAALCVLELLAGKVPLTMIRLALVRHAKSDWGDPALDDHDRPLNERGRARRAAHGAAARRDGLPPRRDPLEHRPARADDGRGLRRGTGRRRHARSRAVRRARDASCWRRRPRAGAASVVVVAHDPGMSVLAARLSGDRIEHMPTCAVATFAWDEDDWDVVDSVEPAEWTFDTPR